LVRNSVKAIFFGNSSGTFPILFPGLY